MCLCCPIRREGEPLIIFNYDFNDMKQKEYIKNFERHLQRYQAIKYIENNRNQFSITLSIFAYIYIIKNDNDLNLGTIPKHLEQINNIINPDNNLKKI